MKGGVGARMIEAARQALVIAKCDHDFIEYSETGFRKRLRCHLCNGTFHYTGELVDNARL